MYIAKTAYHILTKNKNNHKGGTLVVNGVVAGEGLEPTTFGL